MKTVLFINGCVREGHSRSLQLAKAYLETLEGEFHLVERNLMASNLGYLTNTSFDSATGAPLPMDATLAEEFAQADEIVMATPFWEFLFPALVACYFEAVSIAGVTFQYTDHGSEGLCKAKAFTYLYTAGDFIPKEDAICERYLRQLTKLYGIEYFTAISAQGLDIDTNNPQQIVEKVCQEIRNR
ncbi:NAD(P)H-dependent oxidoreductase [Bengtsoniella intestinalis]|uniref:NAD(P)H-dependent oxidoreductase n=1 Tax=Bengtsoniella intestinalis TaxID=3073143 RepID=UPI00391F171F